MKLRTFTGLGCLLCCLSSTGMAQNVAGFWLGVTYPTDPRQAVYNYTMTFTQSGNTLGGTAQTADPNVPFGGVAYLSGQISGSTVRFAESDQNGNTAVPTVCYWRGTLTYNPTDESLIGTYENITNGTTCTEVTGGRVELYRIVLKSGNTFCKGSPIDLVVTGKNIRWYASDQRTNLLATGNRFSPKINRTTTFYITQTLYQNESPAVPITIEVTDPAFNTVTTNADCGQTNGSVALTPVNPGDWQFSLNGGAFGTTPRFNNLGAGTYTVSVKNSAGCRADQSVILTANAGPVISAVQTTPPRCETTSGLLSIVATGGTAPLTYSLDGTSFQASPQFGNLPGGTFTTRVRDAKGCEASRVVSLPAARALILRSADAKPTTCGQPNGEVTLSVAGGTAPIQYSTDGRTFGTASTFGGLPAGTYALTARDSVGCTLSQTVSVAASLAPAAPNVQITPATCGQRNGAVTVVASSPAAQNELLLDGQAFPTNNAVAGLPAGTYVLTVKDAQQCVLTQSVAVPTDCANVVDMPTAFSPNADNRNDALTLYFSVPSLSINRLTIYNRWGSVLYNRTNFAVASGEPVWDGLVNGQPAPTGTYLCLLDCRFPDGTQTVYRQPVTILTTHP